MAAIIWIGVAALIFLLILGLILWKIFGGKKGLVPCIDCGRKISHRAAFCPGCGRKPGGGLFIALIVGAVVAAMIAGGLFFAITKRPPRPKYKSYGTGTGYGYGSGSGSYYKRDYGSGSGSYYKRDYGSGSGRGYGSGSGS